MANLPVFTINGKLDTTRTILQNLILLGNNSQSWITWDPSIGKWSAILNRPIDDLAVASVRDFDDDTIIGPITVIGSGITDKYNLLKISYISDALEGEIDEAFFKIPDSQRYSNELDNELAISYELINNQQQAERLGQIEIKQSRVDKIIQFVTDFRGIGIKPGNIIRVTNTAYDMNLKAFRVATVEEIDTDDGGILVGITALEYLDSVYSPSGIIAVQRDRFNGIVPAEKNICVVTRDLAATAKDVSDSLKSQSGRDNLLQDIQIGNTLVSIPIFQTESLGWSAGDVATVFASGTSSTAFLEAIIQTYRPIKTAYFNFEAPQGTVTFRVDGVLKTFTNLGIPCVLFVYKRPLDVNTLTGVGSYTLISRRYMEWSSYFTQITLDTDSETEFRVIIQPLNTYDLNTGVNPVEFVSSSTYIPNATGDYATLSVAAFLN